MTGDSVLKCVACLEPAPEEWQKMARGPGSHSWHCGCDGSQRATARSASFTRTRQLRARAPSRSRGNAGGSGAARKPVARHPRSGGDERCLHVLKKGRNT
jgi:hypothetical protein